MEMKCKQSILKNRARFLSILVFPSLQGHKTPPGTAASLSPKVSRQLQPVLALGVVGVSKLGEDRILEVQSQA